MFEWIHRGLLFILGPWVKHVAGKEIEAREERIKELEEQLSMKHKTYFKNNMCWAKEDSDLESGPYCSRCLDKDKKLINLHEEVNGYRCPECKTYISTKIDYEPDNPLKGGFFD